MEVASNIIERLQKAKNVSSTIIAVLMESVEQLRQI